MENEYKKRVQIDPSRGFNSHHELYASYFKPCSLPLLNIKEALGFPQPWSSILKELYSSSTFLDLVYKGNPFIKLIK